MPTPLEQSLVAKFDAAKNTFADSYKIGTMDWIKANAPGRLVVIDLADKNLHDVWTQTKTNPALVPFFEAALETWRQAHAAALADWQARSGQ